MRKISDRSWSVIVVSRDKALSQAVSSLMPFVAHWPSLELVLERSVTTRFAPAVLVVAQSAVEAAISKGRSDLDALRVRLQPAPLLLLADEPSISKVGGYPSGFADDVAFPRATVDEIVFRCKSLMRKAESSEGTGADHELGDLKLDGRRQILMFRDKAVRLSSIETRIMNMLCANVSNLTTMSMIIDCWGGAQPTRNAVTRKIYELRRKLRELSESDVTITTRYGAGIFLSLERPRQAG